MSVHVKGLGRSEQGSTDHIKVKLKNDSYGLGANASYEVSYQINMFIYHFMPPEKHKWLVFLMLIYTVYILFQDNWIAHQDDFNELLAQLNNHHGQNKNIGMHIYEKRNRLALLSTV